jgi:hypothetical protein
MREMPEYTVPYRSPDQASRKFEDVSEIGGFIMPAEAKVVKGVKTINYKGKPYVEVSERVRQIHDKDLPFEVQDSVFYEVAGRVVCKVRIKVGEYIYHGQAEAKLFNAVPKSADETNPFECAETSAVGRALAFAGLGTVDGIASFDEIARSVPADELHAALHTEAKGSVQPSRQSSPPTSQSRSDENTAAIATEQQVASIRKLCQHLGKNEPENVTSISFLAAKRLIQQLTAEYKETARKKPEPASAELLASARQMYAKLGREAPKDLDQKSAHVVKMLIEQMTGAYRDLLNAKNGHVPASVEHVPDVKALRKRCQQLGINFDQLVTKVLGVNKPDDNIIPEEQAKLKKALDNIEEVRAKRGQQPEQKAS